MKSSTLLTFLLIVITLFSLANSACDSNCLVCGGGANSTSTECDQCQGGYKLDTGKNCIFDCGVSNCSTCNSTTTCGSCEENFVLQNSICVGLCDSISYYNSSAGSCQLCNSRVSNCNSCSFSNSSNLICLSCDPQFFLNSAVCSSCSSLDHCLTCSSSQTCTACDSTLYALISGKCVVKPTCTVTFCLICLSTSSSFCKQCSAGFNVQADGSCSPKCVQSNGFSYDSASDSCKCISGLVLNSTSNTCIKCQIFNCINCNTASVCRTCFEGYRVTDTGSCEACGQSCLNCSSASRCTLCSSSSFLKNGKCKESDGQGIDHDSSGSDSICHPKCRSCPKVNGIITCVPKDGFYFTATGQIKKCSDNCTTCLSSASFCTSCSSKYFLVGGICVGCSDSNCLKCPNDRGFCTKCAFGYGVVSNGSCLQCVDKCEDCSKSGGGKCDTCIDSYFIVHTNNQYYCSACFKGCSICLATDPGICQYCANGKFLDSTSTCQNCALNCLICTSATTCTNCQTGYQVESGICVASLPLPCTSSVSGVCSSCALPYKIQSNTCVEDRTCNGTIPGTCERCGFGSYLNNQKNCLACPSSSTCRTCSADNTSQCSDCLTGYYLVEALTCQQCLSGCSSCLSKRKCRIASVGYFLEIKDGSSTGNVLACSSKCLTCISDAQLCTSCIEGYSLFVGRCRSNTYVESIVVMTAEALISGFQSFPKSQQRVQLLLFYHIFYIAFLKIFGFTGNEEYLTILSLVPGSVIVTTQMSTSPGQTTAELNNNINSIIANKGSDSGVSIVSGSTSVIGSTTTTTSDTNLALILGLVIPIPTLIIFFICVMLYRKHVISEEEVDQLESGQGVVQEEKVQDNQF